MSIENKNITTFRNITIEILSKAIKDLNSNGIFKAQILVKGEVVWIDHKEKVDKIIVESIQARLIESAVVEQVWAYLDSSDNFVSFDSKVTKERILKYYCRVLICICEAYCKF